MATVEILDRRLGYYEEGLEDDYNVASAEVTTLNEGFDGGGFLTAFKRALGIGDDFGGEHQIALAEKWGNSDVTLSYSARKGGEVFSTLFEHNTQLDQIRHTPNYALDFIREGSQPLRAERHMYRSYGRTREGVPLPLDHYDYRIAEIVLRHALEQPSSHTIIDKPIPTQPHVFT